MLFNKGYFDNFLQVTKNKVINLKDKAEEKTKEYKYIIGLFLLLIWLCLVKVIINYDKFIKREALEELIDNFIFKYLSKFKKKFGLQNRDYAFCILYVNKFREDSLKDIDEKDLSFAYRQLKYSIRCFYYFLKDWDKDLKDSSSNFHFYAKKGINEYMIVRRVDFRQIKEKALVSLVNDEHFDDVDEAKNVDVLVSNKARLFNSKSNNNEVKSDNKLPKFKENTKYNSFTRQYTMINSFMHPLEDNLDIVSLSNDLQKTTLARTFIDKKLGTRMDLKSVEKSFNSNYDKLSNDVFMMKKKHLNIVEQIPRFQRKKLNHVDEIKLVPNELKVKDSFYYQAGKKDINYVKGSNDILPLSNLPIQYKVLAQSAMQDAEISRNGNSIEEEELSQVIDNSLKSKALRAPSIGDNQEPLIVVGKNGDLNKNIKKGGQLPKAITLRIHKSQDINKVINDVTNTLIQDLPKLDTSKWNAYYNLYDDNEHLEYETVTLAPDVKANVNEQHYSLSLNNAIINDRN